MLTLSHSHYRVYNGIILFGYNISSHPKKLHQGRNRDKVRQALDQEGHFVFISKAMLRTIGRGNLHQHTSNRFMVFDQVGLTHSLHS